MVKHEKWALFNVPWYHGSAAEHIWIAAPVRREMNIGPSVEFTLVWSGSSAVYPDFRFDYLLRRVDHRDVIEKVWFVQGYI